nr:MAG TPA: hypothetical protein [Caudoviricetes sp.]
MLEIDGGSIYLTRGDSAVLHVTITNAATGEDYALQETDKLILTVRKQASKLSPVVLEKVLTGSSDFVLAPGDTEKLSVGAYKYDVELRTGGDVYTVIQCSEFKLLVEVTMP